jgi:hypothetical protein
MFELKRLSPAAVPAALAKAERYRLLNEPQQCESICEDILRTDPDNRAAIVMLILALSDEFPHDHARIAARAQSLIARLPEYERHYYGGLVAERRGRALLALPGPGTRAAASWLREAMESYARAEALGPPDNDEARLRWNACARTFNAHPELLVEDDAPSTPVMSE